MGIAEKKPDTLASIHGKQFTHYEQQVRLLLAGVLPAGWQWVPSSRNTVVAVTTAEPIVYYKEFLPRDSFERIKAIFRGNRCERACRQAGVLVAAGLLTPEILCWGNGRKNAFLITKDFAGIGFYQYLKTHFSPPLSQEQIREKRLMLAKAGALIGRMHSKGIVHGDLRQNNLLVTKEGGNFRFSLIDNESNRKWRRIPLSRVMKNLVQFAIYPDNILSGPDLIRLFKAYSANYPRFSGRNRQKLLQTVCLRSKARILESKFNWQCKNFCRTFHSDRFSGQCVLDSVLAKQLASGADFGQWFESADITMKHDKSITVKLLHGPAGNIVVKRFSAKNLLYHLKVWGKKERIFQLWKMTHYFQFLGIPVAPAMGYVLEGTGAWRTVSYFCSHYLENTYNLLELSRNRKIFPVLLNDKQIISSVAGALARLHNNGFCHGDTKWANVLVHPDTGEFWFIDLDGASQVTSILGHGVCKDLSRFLVNIIEHQLPEGYADEFLSAYCRTRRLNKKLVQMAIKPSIEKILNRHKKNKKKEDITRLIEQKKICCALCGSDQYDLLFEGVDRLHGFAGTFSYVKCRECGLVYMNPQICPEHMGNFYPDNYAPHQANIIGITDRDAARANLKKRPFFARLAGKLTKNSRVLDVGCGNGSFLSQVRALTQCQVAGIDISPIAAEAAKKNYGLDIFTGTILEAPFPDNSFDVITAWSFLEHVNNPVEVLVKLSSLLKKDGLCILTTPNFDSFNAKLFKDKWYHLDCPRHLFIYTPQTVKALFEKSGLYVKQIIYDKSSKGVLGSLQYQFYGDNYNPRHGNRLRRSSLVKKIASPFARLAKIMKKSDVMAICAAKSPS